MSEEEKTSLAGDLEREVKEINELKNEKTYLGLQMTLELTRTLQESMRLEEEVLETRARLEKARKPIIRVKI